MLLLSNKYLETAGSLAAAQVSNGTLKLKQSLLFLYLRKGLKKDTFKSKRDGGFGLIVTTKHSQMHCDFGNIQLEEVFNEKTNKQTKTYNRLCAELQYRQWPFAIQVSSRNLFKSRSQNYTYSPLICVIWKY